jgi:DNA repair protein RecN (Recombination protein N)
VEERLAVIERLVRKHGGSLAGVLEHAARSRARRDELSGAELALEETTELLRQADAALEQHVRAIRAARESAAPRLALGVREQLSSLAMPDASFEVTLTPRDHGPSGGDVVEFSIAPNPGVPAGALREIASGGELSRVMLAITTACGGAQRGRRDGAAAGETLVFDEIDAGIGGHAARAVGAQLCEVGKSRQVLCITHLPQIASLADRHFTIAKETSGESTRATVEQLAEREVVAELMRMLGADADDTAARRHARDLRRAA